MASPSNDPLMSRLPAAFRRYGWAAMVLAFLVALASFGGTWEAALGQGTVPPPTAAPTAAPTAVPPPTQAPAPTYIPPIVVPPPVVVPPTPVPTLAQPTVVIVYPTDTPGPQPTLWPTPTSGVDVYATAIAIQNQAAALPTESAATAVEIAATAAALAATAQAVPTQAPQPTLAIAWPTAAPTLQATLLRPTPNAAGEAPDGLLNVTGVRRAGNVNFGTNEGVAVSVPMKQGSAQLRYDQQEYRPDDPNDKTSQQVKDLVGGSNAGNPTRIIDMSCSGSACNSTGTIVLQIRLTAEEYNAAVDPATGRIDPNRFNLIDIKDNPNPPPNQIAVRVPVVCSTDPPPGTCTGLTQGFSTFVLAILPPGQGQRSVPRDARYFQETGTRIARDSFWDYFNRRGGFGALGYPVSQEFTLLGFPVQVFQRAVLQAMPDGSVATMNLLDAGLMPYTQINFSVFPKPDQALIDAAPGPSSPDYADEALAFLKANVPDEWDGMQVNFLQSYRSTVKYEDAFPNGDGEPALVPLMNLEMWGLPTSRPAYDARNGNFVYQRFQRGILHYDASTGVTQGLLLADYFKSIITGQNLPIDLAEQAKGSRFLWQYDAGSPGFVARPGDLPNTDMSYGFDKGIPMEILNPELVVTIPPLQTAVASSVSITPLLVLLPLLSIVGLLMPRGKRGRPNGP